MKYLLIAIMALGLAGCGDLVGDTHTDDSTDNSTHYGSGDVLLCTDSECVAAPYGTDEGDGDAVVGVYSTDYSQSECTSAGFFWCSIENICMDTSLSGGSCN